MADFDPRDATKSPGFNTWGYVGVPKENDVYDFLDTMKEGSDAIFEVINFTFDLINTFLDFIASLLIDFTNPLKIIIEEIIALLEGFVEDLRNLGLYVTFDRFTREDLAEKMLGGYPASEQRMVKKLLNNNDRSRPNFTPETKVFAISLFAGADASGIKRILDTYGQLKRLFAPSEAGQVAQAPINVEGVFYNNVVGEIELPNTYKPDGIRIKWKLPPPASTNKAFPASFIPPDYFLFSIATRRTDDKIGYVRRQISEASDKKKEYKVVASPSVFGPYADPKLWKLFDDIGNFRKLPQEDDYKPIKKALPYLSFDRYKVWSIYNKDNVYLSHIDNKPIDEIYRLFIYQYSGSVIVGDDEFSFDIPLDNLKVNGQLDDEYHITAYSLDSSTLPEIDKTDLEPNAKELKAEINSSAFLTDPKDGFSSGFLVQPVKNITNFSKPSEVATVKAPSDLKTKYLEAVRFFFLGYALSNLNGSGSRKLDISFTKEERDFFKRFTKSDDGIDGFQTSPLNKQEYAREVLEWVDDIMINFKHLLPSEVVLNSRETRTALNDISNFKFDLYGIITDGAQGGSYGFYPNIYQWSLYELRKGFRSRARITDLDNYSKTVVPEGDPNQFVRRSFIDDNVGVRNNAILFFPTGDTEYFGSLCYLKDFRENMIKIKPLIMLSNQSDEDGEWENIKPFRDTDLSSIIDFIDTVKKYLDGLTRGLEGIVAQILKFIHLLQTRIAQLQAVIARIKGMIDLILSFRFPSGLYATFHLADGTSGLVNALVNSEDKPDIGSDGYGLGMMAVAGGVPTLLVDFFIALLGGDSAEEGG